MKKKIKVKFVDFWRAFQDTDNIFWNLLSRNYEPVISDDPDILFYSYFEREFHKYDCTRVLYQGENIRPDFRECDFAFTFDYLPDNPRNFRLPHYVFYDDVRKLCEPRRNPVEIEAEKSKFCAFVVSNKLNVKRLDFFFKLSKYKQVDSGGRVFNNVGGPVDDKMEFLKDYKFVIAFENSSYPGYTTEKIFEPFLCDTIPIYWGNPLVSKDFNTGSFLNFHDYPNEEAFINKIIEVDQNPELYYEMLRQPIFPDNQVNEFADEDKILQQLDRIVHASSNTEPVARRYKHKPKWRKRVRTRAKSAQLKARYNLYMLQRRLNKKGLNK